MKAFLRDKQCRQEVLVKLLPVNRAFYILRSNLKGWSEWGPEDAQEFLVKELKLSKRELEGLLGLGEEARDKIVKDKLRDECQRQKEALLSQIETIAEEERADAYIQEIDRIGAEIERELKVHRGFDAWLRQQRYPPSLDRSTTLEDLESRLGSVERQGLDPAILDGRTPEFDDWMASARRASSRRRRILT